MDSRCPNCHVALDERGICPRCRWPRLSGRLSTVLSLIALLLCGYGLLGYFFYDRLLAGLPQQSRSHEPSPYDISYPLPDVLPQRGPWPYLNGPERDEIMALINRNDYPALSAQLQHYQTEFEADSRNEERLDTVCEFFEISRAGAEPWFDAWVASTPEHFAPYLARGLYFTDRGFASRGSGWAKDTSKEQFERMHSDFARSRIDLLHALELNPRLLPAYIALVRMNGAASGSEDEDARIAQGQQLFPDSYLFYSTVLNFKKPRWGGSYREMETLASQAAQYADRDPRLYQLFAEIYLDQIKSFLHDKDYDHAIEYVKKVMIFGETNQKYHYLALAYVGKADYVAALAAYDEALDHWPRDVVSYGERADCHLKLGDLDKALADIRKYRELAPHDPFVAQWCRSTLANLSPAHEEYRDALQALAVSATAQQ